MAARRGISRVDAIVIMLVGGMLLGVFVLAFSRMRDDSIHFLHTRTDLSSRLKMVTLACHSFHDGTRSCRPRLTSRHP